MTGLEIVAVAGVGFCAGTLGGLVGVGGGVLFVPGLVLLFDQSQVEAEATSLVAIVLVVVVGTMRQRAHGNVRLRDGLIIGALSPLGVLGGTALANGVSERQLELVFAAMQLFFAYRLLRRVFDDRAGEARPEPAS